MIPKKSQMPSAVNVIEQITTDLRNPARELIELRMRHAELNSAIDAYAASGVADELTLRRMKKDRLAFKDRITQLQDELTPPELA
jgi:hypothetical protein